MNQNDYDEDGNKIVECPMCFNSHCPSKDGGKCPKEAEYVEHWRPSCSKCETNPCQCGMMERFDEQFGYCFHIGVETDNITKENIKAFIQYEVEKVFDDLAGDIKKEIEKYSVIIEKCDTIIQNEDFNKGMTEKETWSMLKRNVAKRDALQDWYQEIINIAKRHGFNLLK